MPRTYPLAAFCASNGSSNGSSSSSSSDDAVVSQVPIDRHSRPKSVNVNPIASQSIRYQIVSPTTTGRPISIDRIEEEPGGTQHDASKRRPIFAASIQPPLLARGARTRTPRHDATGQRRRGAGGRGVTWPRPGAVQQPRRHKQQQQQQQQQQQ